MTTPIPQPPALPLLGNVTSIDPANAMHSLGLLFDKYGKQSALNYSSTLTA